MLDHGHQLLIDTSVVGTSTTLGYSYVSGYRLQTADDVLVATNLPVPQHLDDPVVDAAGTTLTLHDTVWVPLLTSSGEIVLAPGTINAIDEPNHGERHVAVRVDDGAHLSRSTRQVLKA